VNHPTHNLLPFVFLCRNSEEIDTQPDPTLTTLLGAGRDQLIIDLPALLISRDNRTLRNLDLFKIFLDLAEFFFFYGLARLTRGDAFVLVPFNALHFDRSVLDAAILRIRVVSYGRRLLRQNRRTSDDQSKSQETRDSH
jgi:hypothetical protein